MFMEGRGGWGSAHQHQRLPGGDRLAFGTQQLFNAAIARGLHGNLHLHGLNHQQHLPGLDLRADAGLHGPDPA